MGTEGGVIAVVGVNLGGHGWFIESPGGLG